MEQLSRKSWETHYPKFWRDIVAFIDNFTTCEITKFLWQRAIFVSVKMASNFK